jgi:hypothetical protein
MTEDEAKQKRCCGPEGCGFTDPRQDDCLNGERWCIGSACMAWVVTARAGQSIPDGTSLIWNKHNEGYCGLKQLTK